MRLKQIAFRLTSADLAILEAAQKRFGAATRIETLRFLLREWSGAAAALVEHEKLQRWK